MNTRSVAKVILDSTLPVDARLALLQGMLKSKNPKSEKSTVVAEILGSETDELIRNTALTNADWLSSERIIRQLYRIVRKARVQGSGGGNIALITLAGLDGVKTIPLLESILNAKDNGRGIRSAAIAALLNLPKAKGNRLLRDLVANDLFDFDERLSAAFWLSQRGDSSGRELFLAALADQSALDSDGPLYFQSLSALCGLVYIRDKRGIRWLITYLKKCLVKSKSPESAASLDSCLLFKFRQKLLQDLCLLPDDGKDCTRQALGFLRSLRKVESPKEVSHLDIP